MPYKISGTKSETARIMVLKESDWSIESNAVVSGSGAYEVDSLETGAKTVVAESNESEVLAFGNVTPIEYGGSTPKELWALGASWQGQLGIGINSTSISTIQQVGSETDWTATAGGNAHNVGVRNGRLWICGSNTYGQLGQGDSGAGTYHSSPVQVGVLDTWDHVAAGEQSTFAIKTDGTLWSWGRNEFGDAGLGNQTSYSTPQQVGGLDDWSKISGHYEHALALKTDGTIWAWGRNFWGACGQNDIIDYSLPVQVGTDDTWADVSAGASFSSALKADGTIWTWGYNANGRLGDTTTTHRSLPVQVGTDFSSISIGGDNGVAIKTNGDLYVWGNNDYGALGFEDWDIRSTPTQLGSDKYLWADVGRYEIATIKTDGTLWMCGNNEDGQCGQNDANYGYSSPVQVGSSTDWVYVECGRCYGASIWAFKEV
jgi:YD repeat-containing protein